MHVREGPGACSRVVNVVAKHLQVMNGRDASVVPDGETDSVVRGLDGENQETQLIFIISLNDYRGLSEKKFGKKKRKKKLTRTGLELGTLTYEITVQQLELWRQATTT